MSIPPEETHKADMGQADEIAPSPAGHSPAEPELPIDVGRQIAVLLQVAARSADELAAAALRQAAELSATTEDEVGRLLVGARREVETVATTLVADDQRAGQLEVKAASLLEGAEKQIRQSGDARAQIEPEATNLRADALEAENRRATADAEAVALVVAALDVADELARTTRENLKRAASLVDEAMREATDIRAAAAAEADGIRAAAARDADERRAEAIEAADAVMADAAADAARTRTRAVEETEAAVAEAAGEAMRLRAEGEREASDVIDAARVRARDLVEESARETEAVRVRSAADAEHIRATALHETAELARQAADEAERLRAEAEHEQPDPAETSSATDNQESKVLTRAQARVAEVALMCHQAQEAASETRRAADLEAIEVVGWAKEKADRLVRGQSGADVALTAPEAGPPTPPGRILAASAAEGSADGTVKGDDAEVGQVDVAGTHRVGEPPG